MTNLIHVNVRLFGPAADWAGQEALEYALRPPATLATLIELLSAKYPRLGSNAGFVRFAVGGEYAGADHPLREGDEVAVIPPVAGGATAFVRLTRDVIVVRGLYRMVEDASCGGVVTFEGIVRREGPPENPLVALEYSAYEDMALRLLQRIRQEARRRFEIHDAAIVHRLGRLEIGECSLAVVVSALHRPAAFDACRWIIETIKKDVPIWKKEIWQKGDATWVHPNPP